MTKLFQGDCLTIMPSLPSTFFDAIICDLPYGTTRNAWDTLIPLGRLWEQYERIIKPNGVIILNAAQPFTTALIGSKPSWFRYADVWQKQNVTGFLNAKKMPLRKHEDICIFSPGRIGRFTYNPQMQIGKVHTRGGGGDRATSNYNTFDTSGYQSNEYYPTSIIAIPYETERFQSRKVRGRKWHPTQKPIGLLEYLVRTYTNPGDIVLDNAMGSGTTGVASVRSGRLFVGIEKQAEYFAQAESRITAELQDRWITS